MEKLNKRPLAIERVCYEWQTQKPKWSGELQTWRKLDKNIIHLDIQQLKTLVLYVLQEHFSFLSISLWFLLYSLYPGH